jgi:pimeloyl-ACP methyl ester carboxylesterase
MERIRIGGCVGCGSWGKDDRFFPVKLAERLAAAIPGARLELIEDAVTFVPEDQPERLATAIARFIAAA